MATAPKKIPQWKLDMLADATVAADLVIKKAEADKAAAETAERLAKEKAERDAACANFHAWKLTNKYVMERVQVSAGVASKTERGWEVEPKYRMMQVPNKEKCSYCGKP
jgi:hypothetical protein